jgi:hypothetical protein
MECVVYKGRLTLGGFVSAAALGAAVFTAAPALAQTNAVAEPAHVTAVSDGPSSSPLGGLLGAGDGKVSDWGTGNTMQTANTDPESRGGEGLLGLDSLVDLVQRVLGGVLGAL